MRLHYEVYIPVVLAKQIRSVLGKIFVFNNVVLTLTIDTLKLL